MSEYMIPPIDGWYDGHHYDSTDEAQCKIKLNGMGMHSVSHPPALSAPPLSPRLNKIIYGSLYPDRRDLGEWLVDFLLIEENGYLEYHPVKPNQEWRDRAVRVADWLFRDGIGLYVSTSVRNSKIIKVQPGGHWDEGYGYAECLGDCQRVVIALHDRPCLHCGGPVDFSSGKIIMADKDAARFRFDRDHQSPLPINVGPTSDRHTFESVLPLDDEPMAEETEWLRRQVLDHELLRQQVLDQDRRIGDLERIVGKLMRGEAGGA